MRITGITIVMIIAGACVACGSEDPIAYTDASRTAVTTDAGDHRSGDASADDTDASRPMSTNPLIAKLPGMWIRIEPSDGLTVNVEVDPNNPDCTFQGQPLGEPKGDACVLHFSPPGLLILSDARLYRNSAVTQDRVEGRVLEDGRRVEFDLTITTTQRFIYERL